MPAMLSISIAENAKIVENSHILDMYGDIMVVGIPPAIYTSTKKKGYQNAIPGVLLLQL